jgi:hypothetical protein
VVAYVLDILLFAYKNIDAPIFPNLFLLYIYGFLLLT